jgi:hypothetical protein
MAYILVTGWDQKVTLFIDEPNAITLEAVSEWPISPGGGNWHSDDILSLEFCEPDIIASSSYTGQIVLCNLQSGLILHTFNPHDDRTPDFPTQQKSIDRLLFLHSRFEQYPQAACLISTGGDGIIRFWKTTTAELYWEVDCRPIGNSDGIYVMDTNDANSLLFFADSAGTVHIHNIKEAGFTKASDQKHMNPTRSFQAHVHTITALNYVDAESLIITSSVDHSTRLFTVSLNNQIDGHFIGIFGQSEAWNLRNPSSYAHPFLPWDISDYLGPNGVRKYAEKLKPSGHSKGDSESTLYNLMNRYIHGSANSLEREHISRKTTPNRGEGTWFSRTHYANQRFLQKPPRRVLPLERRHPVQNGLGGLRVFTHLRPTDLDDIVPYPLKGSRPSARHTRSITCLSRAK